MDAFTRFIASHHSTGGRAFISNPPGPALLLWSNSNSLPNITGVSLVKSINSSTSIGVPSQIVSALLKQQLNTQINFLDIEYDPNLNGMVIDGQNYSMSDAAGYISKTFNVGLGNSNPKRPNNLSMINDPFHLWSRSVFSGTSVMKIDIDLLMLNQTMNQITSIVEIKRSARSPVGIWKPYINPQANNDINNYFMMMSFANCLGVDFHTIHHEEVRTNVALNPNDNVDIFSYRPSNQQPNQQILNLFGAENNRNQQTVTYVANML
ncbi:hypothetical protein [Bacillus bingmayongensis]|uniref:hypothetical protein n=1 Tax=Bacillus bingmayongensis TaxID=1150157 RepID=UPI001C8E33F4|nr:hypothetical protein [Bacillus bingmayongensis]MBY0596488.1 hypothetical protein [Bacillus bingmayongensis]